jgi:hypothetical protein
MNSLWKSFWMVCALSGALTAAAGCGPEQPFCPNTGNAGVCPILGDDGGPLMRDSGTGSLCPNDAALVFDPTTNTFVCPT